MEIDWKEYQLLRSHQAISGPDAMEAIQYIREKLRLTTDPLAAWQWGYAHLVWMIYTFRNQLYPRFDEIGQYNPPHQPTIVQEDSEHVLF